ncbi:MAG: TetR/AcrR family transcriptional regulator [Bacteroidota bacterium]|nr:TetR/AcrR family transcriptional regulator [Bacteroidota bacterium]
MSPKEKSQSKRKSILDSAVIIFAKDGINKGTIASIAKQADIGKGTIYEYFKSKEEIFEEMLNYFFKDLFSGWKQLNKLEISTKKKLEKIFDLTFDYLSSINEKNYHQLIILMEIMLFAIRKDLEQSSKIDLSEILRNLYKIIVPIIDAGKKEGLLKNINKEYFTFLLFSSLDGIALHYFIQRKHFDIEKIKKYSMEMFFNGILKDNYSKEKIDNFNFMGVGSLPKKRR